MNKKDANLEIAASGREDPLALAIASISEGFAVFDADDRLVLCNERYKQHYPGLADIFEPGVAFERIVGTVADRGVVDGVGERPEEWVHERLDRHRNPSGPILQRQADGRWIQINETRTRDGGSVAVYTDVTDLKRHEEELARVVRDKDAVLNEFNAVMDAIDYGILFLGHDLRPRLFNRAFGEMWDFQKDWLARKGTMRELIENVRQRGLYKVPDDEFEDYADARIEAIRNGDIAPVEFHIADGRVFQYQCKSLPDGGRMLTYFDITELKRAEQAIRQAKDHAERTLAELKRTQNSLVQSEKLALLGQLVAGIAHEIKNPLNFINNFAGLSAELLRELKGLLDNALSDRDPGGRDEIDDLIATLTANLERIGQHGARANSIVKSMLSHSRQGPGERREADINALVEESLNLAYHGARAQDQNFNVTLERDFDKTAGSLEVIPQDLSRVLLNLFANGFYATQKRKREKDEAGYQPTLRASTRRHDHAVEIRVRDNGAGIPKDVVDKIFTPFFTTKPTGEGTGLGLSLSYDIIVHQHNGAFDVDTRDGEYTEFIVSLPCEADGGTRETEPEVAP